jgi:hypothetical protein
LLEPINIVVAEAIANSLRQTDFKPIVFYSLERENEKGAAFNAAYFADEVRVRTFAGAGCASK